MILTIHNDIQLQLSGYGTTPSQSEAIVRYLGLKEPVNLSAWEAVCVFYLLKHVERYPRSSRCLHVHPIPNYCSTE